MISNCSFPELGAVLVKTNLDCPKGYTCRYVKDPPCELRADVKQFDKSLDALMAVLFAKVRFPIQCRSTNLRFCIIHILSFLNSENYLADHGYYQQRRRK